jgi:hypothetical protein
VKRAPVVFSPCDYNKLGVEMSTGAGTELSDAELAMFAADVSRAISGAGIEIDGAAVPTLTAPQFTVTDGENTKTCK